MDERPLRRGWQAIAILGGVLTVAGVILVVVTFGAALGLWDLPW